MVALIALLLIIGVFIYACGGGGGSATIAEFKSTPPITDTVQTGVFPLPDPAVLLGKTEPGREVSTVKNAADFRTDLPNAMVTV